MSNVEDRLRFKPLLNSAVEVLEPEPTIDPTTDAKAFLEAVLSSADQPMSRRMKAAETLIAYQYPKRPSSAAGPNAGFAKGLERALKLSRGEPVTIDGNAERTGDVNR